MIITPGQKNSNVKILQLLLKYFGYKISADGSYGPQTKEVILNFQKENGLKMDGIVGPVTMWRFAEKDKLLSSIMKIESNGDDNIIGDLKLTNKAYGCLQIRQGVVDEVNTKLKTSFKAEECYGNRILSLLIWYTYWIIYPGRDDEDKAKSWNGGPAWRRYYGKPGKETYTKNLDLYWSKVKKLLN